MPSDFVYFDARSKSSLRTSGWESYSRNIFSTDIHKAIFNLPIFTKHPVLIVISDIIIGLRLVFSKRIAHFPTFPPFFPRSRDCFTIHDLVWISYPEYSSIMGKFYFCYLTKKAIVRVGIIFVPSETIAAELRVRFPIASKKIRVVALGKNEVELFDTTSGGLNPYLLTIGTNEPRKNILGLIEAFANAAIPQNWKLIVIGRSAWEVKIDTDKVANVDHLENLTNLEIAQMYQNARGYVLPSKYEGFSLTILEATGYRLPILCSEIPAHKEFSFENMFFFKSLDVDTMRYDLELFINEIIPNFTFKEQFQELLKYDWQTTRTKNSQYYSSLQMAYDK